VPGKRVLRQLVPIQLRQLGSALVVIGILHVASGVALAQTEDPTADQIVNRAVARSERQRVSGVGLEYEATIEEFTEHLEGDGTVDKTESQTFKQYALEGVLYEELLTKNGELLDEDDFRDEMESREEFAEDVRERRVKGEEPLPRGDNDVDFDQEFVERYDYALVGEATVAGHECWIIYLVPSDMDLPSSRNIDSALNNSTGHLSISKDDYGLVQVEFEMARSARFWWGLLGTLRDTKGRLEFTRVAEGVWLPHIVDIQSDLRILLRGRVRRVVREWSEYVPVSVAQ
jgi:hypothetical protein